MTRSLRESGSQVDNKQAFAVLDSEAYRPCDRDESGAGEAKGSSAAEHAPAATPEILATVIAPRSAVIADEGTPPSVVVEEPPSAHPRATLDDLRGQLVQAPKERSRSASSAATETMQLTLW